MNKIRVLESYLAELHRSQMGQVLRRNYLYEMLRNEPVGDEQCLDVASSQNAPQHVDCMLSGRRRDPPEAANQSDLPHALTQSCIVLEDLDETRERVWATVVECDVAEAHPLRLGSEGPADEGADAECIILAAAHIIDDVVDDFLR
jgi:hypothetical protein